MKKPLVAILAGGKSIRFGRDKARIEIQGKPLLEHLLQRIDAANFPSLVIGREPQQHDSWEGIPDRQPDAGPAEGLASALAYAASLGYAELILLAVDMPCIDAPFLDWLSGLPASEAVIPVLADRDQYCAARFATQALATIDKNLRRSKRSLHEQVASLRSQRYKIPPELTHACSSFNTPSELIELFDKGLLHD